MARRFRNNVEQNRARTTVDLLKLVSCDATVSKTDTVKINELTTLTVHEVYNATTGVAVAHTVLNNVITITEDPCLNVKVFIVCIGDLV